MASLVGEGGPVKGQRFEIDSEKGIGREDADVLVADPEVSRHHALVRPVPDGGLEIVDRGSTNGTFVNDERIAGPTRLSHGDRVRVGQTIFVVDDPPPSTAWDPNATLVSERPGAVAAAETEPLPARRPEASRGGRTAAIALAVVLAGAGALLAYRTLSGSEPGFAEQASRACERATRRLGSVDFSGRAGAVRRSARRLRTTASALRERIRSLDASEPERARAFAAALSELSGAARRLERAAGGRAPRVRAARADLRRARASVRRAAARMGVPACVRFARRA